jgi:uncharacterized protein (DUF2249 family)
MNFKKVDVRKLMKEGIEPLPHIRKSVDSLKRGQGLAVVAPFLPSPLIELLKSEKFETRAERSQDGSWTTYFWRETAGTE